MIARQLRLVTLARDLMDAGHGGAELGGRLGISRDFVLKKTVEQARKHSRDTLRWLYGKLLEADLAVKQGKLDQDLALQLLAALVGGPARPPHQARPASAQPATDRADPIRVGPRSEPRRLRSRLPLIYFPTARGRSPPRRAFVEWDRIGRPRPGSLWARVPPSPTPSGMPRMSLISFS